MHAWKSIDSAPYNIELELSIFADGEYHALVFACRRDGSGWREVGIDRPIHLKPTHWRPWQRDTKAQA
jgi:hypothetical protein